MRTRSLGITVPVDSYVVGSVYYSSIGPTMACGLLRLMSECPARIKPHLATIALGRVNVANCKQVTSMTIDSCGHGMTMFWKTMIPEHITYGISA